MFWVVAAFLAGIVVYWAVLTWASKETVVRVEVPVTQTPGPTGCFLHINDPDKNVDLTVPCTTTTLTPAPSEGSTQ